MPAMTFLYALKQQGINKQDVLVDTSVEFAALSGAFIGGSADYVNLFEPTAYKLEKEKYGCVLSSLGLLAGEVPYTVFNTRLSYYNDNPAIIKSFTKALNKGLKYAKKHSSKEIAQVIKNQFPDNSIEELTLIVERYKNADSWWDNTYIEKSAFDRLEDLMKYNGVLKNGNNYNSLVKNDYNE